MNLTKGIALVCFASLWIGAAPAPAQAVKASPPAEVDGQSYDLVVVGGTPGGVACAVRAAREGLRVLLINRHGHLGGMLTSGLAVWDSQYEGKRSPIYDEVRAAIMEHYRATYGADSPQFRDAQPGATGYTNGRFESRVAETIIDGIVSREPRLSVLRSFVPITVQRDGARLNAITLQAAQGETRVRVRGEAFADATYEGDLAALAKVPYRVGREGRAEFGEPHAGIVFMHAAPEPANAEAARFAELHDQLKLRKFAGFQSLLPVSTGAPDPAVQACNYRTLLSTDANNRVPIAKPANYDAYFLKSLEIFSGVESVPNAKFSWNRPQLIGRQTEYVEADWKGRQRIEDDHWEATMGLLYFLQNDLTVPSIVRRAWQEYGLAKDEFADNGHRPHEMYVRETRRIAGRAIFTEHDATLAPGLLRAPVQPDSVATTEWYMDSHSCTPARVPGGLEEGKFMLHHETFPAQIPYRCLLPQGVDNLLVPVCLSATHVAWGTVRLEPAWMQIGESAGVAAALAQKKKVTLAGLDTDALVHRLCELRSMVSFFNDAEMASSAPWIPAAQYFGTKGFFADYDVRAATPLKQATGRLWIEGLKQLRAGTLDPMEQARAIVVAEAVDSAPMPAGEFSAALSAGGEKAREASAPITRGEALARMFAALK
jgi:hypothetical protein